MAQALNENLDSSLTFLRNCSLVGSDAAGWCTQEDGHVAATFPVAGQDTDSAETARTEPWCPEMMYTWESFLKK